MGGWRGGGEFGVDSGHTGALDGGSPMSPVDFKKWPCLLSLF